ncbi:MAG: extracellular solute-binding protein, partial [bacterium]
MYKFIFTIFLLLPIFCFSKTPSKITLHVSSWADSKGEIEADKKILQEFMKTHANVRVFYEPILAFQAYEQKILSSIVANAPPDVFLLDSKIIPSFINKNILVDLMPFVQKQGIDLSIYFPNVLAIAERDSSLFAFPKDFTPLVISYNKKLFDRASIPYPAANWTWNDFILIAQKLTQDTDGDGNTDQFGTLIPNAFYYWITFVWMNGGDVLSPDGRQAIEYFNSPETESALQFIIDLHQQYRVSPNTGSYGQTERAGLTNTLFMSNRIAMCIDGHWSLTRYLPYLKTGELDTGVAPLPSPRNKPRVNVMYESGWCVPKNTPYPELAVELAAFLAGEKASRVRSKLGLAIPAVKSVATEQAANDSLGLEKVFFEEIPYCRQPWGTLVERFTELELIFQDAFDEVLINNKPIHPTFTNYAKQIDDKLEQIRSLKSFQVGTLKGNREVLNFLLGVCAITLALGFYGLFITKEKKGTSTRKFERLKTLKGFTFLLPSFVHLLIFFITPIAFAFYLSVHRWEIIVPNKPFIGAENFIEMFGDPLFWNALKNTLLFSVNVPVGMVFALTVAVMLNQKIKGVNILRTLYFLPSVSSFVAVALVWRFLYEPNFGLANYLLNILSLPQSQWLNSPNTA